MWSCGTCTYRNQQWYTECEMCLTPNPESQGACGGDENVFQGDNKLGWQCPECTLINESHKTSCSICSFAFAKGNKFDLENEIRIVLIGRTGSGKSATGNSLLGIQIFQSKLSAISVTSKCKRGEQCREGKKVVVIDTPGLFDTGMTNEQVTKEIIKCIGMTSPGPNAFALVVDIGRFTKEVQDTVQHCADLFGEGMRKYMIVLFTRNDELTKRNQSFHEYLAGSSDEMRDLLHQCNNRYVAFNNDALGQEMEDQVNAFYEMVNKIMRDNGGSCYTSELYKEAESALQRRMEKQVLKLKIEKEKEKEEIERKIQEKYQQKLDKEILQKSQLEDELKRKRDEEKKNEKEKEDLENTIKNMNASRLKSDLNKEEKRKVDEEIEKLKEQLAEVERRTTKKETDTLQRKYDEAENRHMREIKEMKKEIQDLSKKKDEEYNINVMLILSICCCLCVYCFWLLI